MKRFLAAFLAIVICIITMISAGAYDFPRDTVIHEFNSQLYLRKRSAAEKWDGRTALRENTYYYTTKSVTVSQNITLPEGSTLEVRAPLKITNKAKLTVCGDLIIDYSGKVNPYSGTLAVKDSGYVHCFGGISVSKNGSLDVKGQLFVMDKGSLSVKGTVNVASDGCIVSAGAYKRYSTAKITGEIQSAGNITDELSQALEGISDSERVFVNFCFYDPETMKNTTIDGKNLLEVSLEIQDKYSVPAMISYALFNEENGSYKEFAAASKVRTNEFTRWLKTNFGGSKGFKRYLSNDYFSSIAPNPAYADKKAVIPSDNKYIVSEEYLKLFRLRTELAETLDKALYEELSGFGFEELCIINPLENGHGIFAAELTKSQINSLSADSRFLFLSVNDKKTIIKGTDKLYISNGSGGYLNASDWNRIAEEYGGTVCVVSKGDVIPGGSGASDKAYERVAAYTDITWNAGNGTWYNTAEAGIFNISLFSRNQHDGLYSFCGYWNDIYAANRNVTENYILNSCVQRGLFGDCYVYHCVTLSSAEELEALAADENVLLIIEEQAELE